ncbi:MAG: hypothetical protein COA67_03895 [Lutibacter sp.]|nr:MAG: hypothetical protein COA67_03895 [Lutibacter sp.]
MNKLIILVLLLFTTSSSIDPNKIENNVETSGIYIEDAQYNIHIDVETTTENKLNLVVKMELKNGSHFASPHNTRNLKEQFYMDLGSYTDIDFVDAHIETPKPKSGCGSSAYSDTKVNWIKTNTTYRQPLHVISKGDFQVFGRIKFVIEPRCTLEELPFAIISKNGEFKVTQPKC